MSFFWYKSEVILHAPFKVKDTHTQGTKWRMLDGTILQQYSISYRY